MSRKSSTNVLTAPGTHDFLEMWYFWFESVEQRTHKFVLCATNFLKYGLSGRVSPLSNPLQCDCVNFPPLLRSLDAFKWMSFGSPASRLHQESILAALFILQQIEKSQKFSMWLRFEMCSSMPIPIHSKLSPEAAFSLVASALVLRNCLSSILKGHFFTPSVSICAEVSHQL